MGQEIKGYRQLSQDEIDAVNNIKGLEDSLGDWIQELRHSLDVDPKFTAVAVTHFQQGFMALNRAITKPESRLK